MIEIVDIWKSFSRKKILCGVNLSISDGEIMVIIGGSGAGKTVLLKHIIGLLKPDRGQIFINSISLSTAATSHLEKIRKQFGMVFQSSALLNSLTVWENVALPLIEHTNMSTEEIGKLVSEKLNLVQLHGIEREMPANLSGGMKKRIAVARAIIRNPAIILYDEPTSGLDPVTGHSIENLIVDLKRNLNVTSVIVTHDIEGACRMADRIAMLLHGEIVEVGTPSETRKSSNPAIRQFLQYEK